MCPFTSTDDVVVTSVGAANMGRMLLQLILLAIAVTATISGAHASPSNSWNAIDWFPCPDNNVTLCAFFSVPLDYTNPSTNENVSLALRMLPATAPSNQQMGTIITNPGGPGSSGTEFIIALGKELSTIVEGKYNILSFDPRAVNLTSPPPNCFPTSGDAAIFSRDVQQHGYPSGAKGNVTDPGASLSIEANWVRKFDAYAVALDKVCAMRGDKGILRSSSTPFTARDMLSIVDALGEEKLSFWGFSYGTILGATFAAMFPDRVHRFILDGVSDAVSYNSDLWEWTRGGLVDTNKTWANFLDGCASSGPKGCALAGSNLTARQIGGRIEKLISRLRVSPLPVPISEVGTGVVTSRYVTDLIFQALYAPKAWPGLAQTLANLEKGNGSALYETARADNDALCRDTDPLDNVFHRYMDNSLASSNSILCGDTDTSVLKNSSAEQVAEFMRELSEMAIGGEFWSQPVRYCRRWSHNATEVYRGPWKVEDGLPKPSFPILFMSNTADPVTPLASARSMASNFGNESASLVIQNGGNGHTTTAQLSLCITKVVRAYFVEGVVPMNGTVCDVEPDPLFPHPDDEAGHSGMMMRRGEEEVSEMSVGDEKLLEAVRSISDKVRYIFPRRNMGM